jgi:hypothetical protein
VVAAAVAAAVARTEPVVADVVLAGAELRAPPSLGEGEHPASKAARAQRRFIVGGYQSSNLPVRPAGGTREAEEQEGRRGGRPPQESENGSALRRSHET